MDIQARVARVKVRIEELKMKDAGLENFGAGDNPWYNMTGHHYEFNPVLSEDEIASAEKRLDITFPEEYREYLKSAGNGGAGPAWGLFPLEDATPNDALLQECPDFCSMEFPYYDSYAAGIYEELSKDFSHRGPFHDPFGGYIQLANYGHDMKAILIVSGEQRGTMWLMDEGNSLTPFVQTVNGKTSGVSFLDWYENWLNEHLVPGSMPAQF